MDEEQRQSASFASRRREYGLRFVARVYPARILGLALGGIAIASVFWVLHAPLALWFALWASALAWPHFAYGLGVNSADPFRTELRCLMVDSALGGAFIALMKFSVLPSALFVTMLSMDKIAIGGMRFLLPCSAALVGACVLVGLATGFTVQPQTTMLEIYGSLPLLFIYPLVVGFTSYRMARQLRYQNKQLEAMSSADGLSHMPTRPAWEKLVAEDFQACRRTGEPSSVLLLDIDDLEAVNTRHGHAVGDEVIRTVAGTVRNALREFDMAGRFGGKEFAALLSGMDEQRATQVAERIRKAVGSCVVEKTGELHCSVSIGVARIDPRDRASGDSIVRARQALRAAKGKGGNRVEVAGQGA